MLSDSLAFVTVWNLSVFHSSGPRKGREVYRHFGKAPGTPHSHTKYVSNLTSKQMFWYLYCINVEQYM